MPVTKLPMVTDLALALLPLLYLWVVLIRQLSVAWDNNPQYAYGWSVPFLCLYLLWRKLRPEIPDHGTSWKRVESRRLNTGAAQTEASELRNADTWTIRNTLLLAVLATAWFPIRLVQEANPGWSLVSWAQAATVIGLTLLLVHCVLLNLNRQVLNSRPAHGPEIKVSSFPLSTLVFPICFFLVAVPWPYMLENPVIQGLTQLNTTLTIDLLGSVGIPSVQHGNLVELATGTVGINEACSGIRSLQATLMISLFLGELYHLSALRRLLCVGAGFAFAMVCNLIRMLILCWVASQRGIGAIAKWHDPSGVTILLACFIGVWIFAKCMRGKSNSSETSSVEAIPMAKSLLEQIATAVSHHRILFGSLAAWMVIVEFSVAGWYHHIEANLPMQPSWYIDWPTNALGFREIPVPKEAAHMLRYDAARQVQWTSDNGRKWQLSWFYWKPGTAAAYLAKSHNPLVCMPAAGYETSRVSPPRSANINDLQIPFRVYSFDQSGNRIHVLYSRWEDKAMEQSFAKEGVTRFNRLRSVWTGRGSCGQRAISLAAWGMEEGEDPEEVLIRQLRTHLKPEAPRQH